MKLAAELINISVVKYKRVRIIFNLKNVLLGSFKSNLSAREININKSILLIKLGSSDAREIEVVSLLRVCNSLIRDSRF